RKVDDYECKDEKIPFHIATMHGSLAGDHAHATYAPFKLTDLTKKPFDYWALGHIHKRQILHQSPPVVYPGNIQGRHYLENHAKGCYYVELTHASAELTFVPLHAIEFVSLELDATHCETIFALEQLLEQRLIEIKQSSTPQLMKLHLLGSDQLFEWEQYEYLAEMIELLNEQHLLLDNWLYIYDVTTTIQQTNDSIGQNDHFLD